MLTEKIVTHFNGDLYRKIRRERERVKYPVSNLNIEVSDSPLINRKVIQGTELGFIESVWKQYFDGGWYIAVLLNFNGSHVLRYWENINCPVDYMIDFITETRNEIVLL